MKHTSRIERGRLASFNAAFWVPCPHCRRYQTLRMDRVTWDKTEAGKSDKDLARRTARYVCAHCDAEIRDEHRGPMMRAGVWIPEGCGCDDEKARDAAEAWKQDGRPAWRGWSDSPWITGTPLRDGRDAGYQLSSLYALSLSWGDIAAEFVDSKKNPQNLRNFVNQWLAETWEIASRKASWEEVAQRLIDPEITRGVVPLWASMLTMAIDRQADDRHPWVVDAWGPGRRCASIAYGYAATPEEAEKLALAFWPHADGGSPLRPSLVLVDSGHRPLGVYEMCDRLKAAGVPSLACKGSNVALNSDYDVVTLGKNTSRPGTVLCHVDTIRSQIWVHHAIYDAKRDEEGGFALYSGSNWEHEDFLKQLENDQPIEATDSRNNARESWERIDENTPNDYRDLKRYSYVAMLIATRHGPIASRRYTPAPVVQQPTRVRELRIRGR
jgi:phage terminase large subunit GpA-like protein